MKNNTNPTILNKAKAIVPFEPQESTNSFKIKPKVPITKKVIIKVSILFFILTHFILHFLYNYSIQNLENNQFIVILI